MFQNTSVEDALSNFREKWQRELEITQDKKNVKEELKDCKNEKEDEDSEEKDMVEAKARMWFLEGVENEQKGKLYEAIQFYRKAVQLVPDIEFRLYETARVKPKDRTQTECSEGRLLCLLYWTFPGL